MKTLFYLLILVNLHLLSYSQVVSGVVLDKTSNNPICFATVYFSGTFVGTSTDKNGSFELKYRGTNAMPLTISAIGYYSQVLPVNSFSDSFVIRLRPKTYQLSDARVEAESLERKRRRYLRLFKEEFIGTSFNAAHCKIINEEDITFNYDTDKDTIKAYALKPILVENSAMGYTIHYYLDKFEYYKKEQATFFTGNLKFEEDFSLNSADKEAYEHRRKEVYRGSRMHFFRTLWAEELEESLFKVRNAQGCYLVMEDLLQMDKNHNKYVGYRGKLIVEYGSSRSSIEFINSPVYFDATGFFNPGIKWSGAMALQRVADWLPYEFQME